MKVQENQRGVHWVYIPQWVCEKLGLRKGDVLSIVEVGGDEIILKVIRSNSGNISKGGN